MPNCEGRGTSVRAFGGMCEGYIRALGAGQYPDPGRVEPSCGWLPWTRGAGTGCERGGGGGGGGRGEGVSLLLFEVEEGGEHSSNALGRDQISEVPQVAPSVVGHGPAHSEVREADAGARAGRTTCKAAEGSKQKVYDIETAPGVRGREAVCLTVEAMAGRRIQEAAVKRSVPDCSRNPWGGGPGEDIVKNKGRKEGRKEGGQKGDRPGDVGTGGASEVCPRCTNWVWVWVWGRARLWDGRSMQRRAEMGDTTAETRLTGTDWTTKASRRGV